MNQSSDQHSAGQPPEGSQTDSENLSSFFLSSIKEVHDRAEGLARHREFVGKDTQKLFFMRSIMDPQSGIEIDRNCPLKRVVVS
ncbi:MAG: hypothetical protein WCN89_00980, partial [bacterium]